MKIIEVRAFAVEIEDGGYRSDVFQQGDGRLKCQSSRCASRNHFKCGHVQFVQSQGVIPPGLPPMSEEELRDLIDE